MRRFVALLAVLLLVIFVRMTTWKAVFTGNDVSPYDTDPYYRLRQMLLVAHHFPSPPPPDTYSMGVEEGVDPTFERSEPWLHPSIFLTAWALAGFNKDDAALRQAAMFVPLVWALLTTALAFVVALLIADGFAAFMAAIFAGVCMPLLWRTSLGALDNHMTEGAIFLFILLLPALLANLPDALAGRRIRVAILGLILGACALLSYWTVLGVLLLCASCSVGLVLFARSGKQDNASLYTRASLLAVIFIIAGASNLVFANISSGLTMAAAGVYLLAQVFLWRVLPRAAVAVWALLVVAAIALTWMAAPGLVTQLESTARVAFHLSEKPGITELLYSTINETGGIPLTQIHTRFSLLAWICPVLVILLLCQAYKERDFTKLAICLVFVALFIPSLWNRRFTNMAAAAMAPLVGWGLAGIAALCARPLSKLVKTTTAAGISKTIITILMLVGFEPIVQWNTYVRLTQASIDTPLKETFQWMKSKLPACDNYWNPVDPPPYRIMAPWEIGWWILDQAQRAPVANPAGEGMLASLDFFFRATPEDAAAIIEKQNARYVLVNPSGGRAAKAFRVLGLLPDSVTLNLKDPDNEKTINDKYLTTTHAALYLHDGSAYSVAESQYPPLQHYRLIFEAWAQSDTPFGKYPGAKVFEVVRGATITGHTTPGASATVKLELESNSGRKFSYTETRNADAEGNVTFTLPYATDAPNGETKALGKWIFESEGQQIPIDIATDAVLEGKSPQPKAPSEK